MLVKRVAEDVLATIPQRQGSAGRQPGEGQAADRKRSLAPNFDFTRMTALAMGPQLAQRHSGAAKSS